MYLQKEKTKAKKKNTYIYIHILARESKLLIVLVELHKIQFRDSQAHWWIPGLMITFILGLTKCLIILSFDQSSFRFERTYILAY